MSSVFHRNLKGGLPVASHGDGVYIVDTKGKRYIDASGGAAVSCLGHSDVGVRKALHEQLDKLAFAHTAFFTNEPMERLADTMIAHAPEGMEKVYFVSGGSEAVETAIKLARRYHVEKGQESRRIFIARNQSYHGNTLGALSVGGNVGRRAGFDSMLMEVRRIGPCYAYRGQLPGESERAYGKRMAGELEAAILEAGPENVAAFVAETVVGATLGVVPPAAGYFRHVREICDKYGVLLILDEVMCGMGRTGTLHACEQDKVTPDLMAVAKGLGGGYQPIGAVFVSGKVFDAIGKGSGSFLSGHTYIGHPMACTAALAIQDAIIGRDLLKAVRRQGKAFDKLLRDRFSESPFVGDIRGRGLFRGVELVADRQTKKPFDPKLKLNARIKANAMERGMVCYPGGGGVDGVAGDHILLAPPYIVTSEQLVEIVDKLELAINDALKDSGAAKAKKGRQKVTAR
ncbi:MAG: aspartate aminotransferase family protein [Rhodospirillales bacterium]|nr:aspartate aminotransferase family protein [Rhodospirillales bacterium]